MAYCITHELNGVTWVDGNHDCVMATCPPPEGDPEWNLHLVDPSEEELVMIDMNAEVFEAELFI